ncbi:hypothetical protein ABTZ58_39295 [Streptomyces sp. NPDC094143]|uniref:hypothetical protein n=1 Tax=Streptomyces sp. NPDC094143 TaxID=3155310 RepID=UPI00332B0A9C
MLGDSLHELSVGEVSLQHSCFGSIRRAVAQCSDDGPLLNPHYECETEDDYALAAPAYRPLAPRVAVPREPVDPARIRRRVVRRRAKGMDAGAVAAALEDARFDVWQDSRHEDLVDDVRGRAELAEWEPLDQPLAAAAADREAAVRGAQRIAARADELQALREFHALEQTEPRDGDEAARDELTRRADGYVQADVDAWLAHALAAHLGRYRPGRP